MHLSNMPARLTLPFVTTMVTMAVLLKMPSKPIVRKRDNSYLFVAPTRIFRTALQNGKSETFKIVHVP